MHELTTPDAHFASGERDEDIRTLAMHFKRQCAELVKTTLEIDLIPRACAALGPALASSTRGDRDNGQNASVSTESGGTDADADADADAAMYAMRAVSNLLLASDERSAQLRKAVAGGEMVETILTPSLTRAMAIARGASSSDAARAHRARTRACDALAALGVATFKMGTLRQRLLADRPGGGGATSTAAAASDPLRDALPAGLLSVPSLSSSPAVLDLFLRLACNLGVGVGDDGGGEPAATGRARWRRQISDALRAASGEDKARLSSRFARDARATPVTREGATHAWIVSMLPPPAPRREIDETAGGDRDRKKKRRKKKKKSERGGGDSRAAPAWQSEGKEERERSRRRERRPERREPPGATTTKASDDDDEVDPPPPPPPPRAGPRIVAASSSTVIEVKAARAWSRSSPSFSSSDDERPPPPPDSDSDANSDEASSDSSAPRVNRLEPARGMYTRVHTSALPYLDDDVDGDDGADFDVDALLAEVDALGTGGGGGGGGR